MSASPIPKELATFIFNRRISRRLVPMQAHYLVSTDGTALFTFAPRCALAKHLWADIVESQLHVNDLISIPCMWSGPTSPWFEVPLIGDQEQAKVNSSVEINGFMLGRVKLV
jgi:hypothetical protein